MDVRELRLGNILEKEGVKFNVGHIQDNFHGIYVNGKGLLSEIKPIPLTEE